MDFYASGILYEPNRVKAIFLLPMDLLSPVQAVRNCIKLECANGSRQKGSFKWPYFHQLIRSPETAARIAVEEY